MRLYLIRRRSDGRFFVSINGFQKLIRPHVDAQYWSYRAQYFFKTADGVAGNLRKLCSAPYWNTKAPPGVAPQVAAGWGEVAWKDFDASKLERFEIVTTEVDILSTTTTLASKFIQIEAIANHPLNSFERAA